MSEKIDKELDEIMGLINREHPQRPVRTTQGTKSASRKPRYAMPNNNRPTSDSERLQRMYKRRRKVKIRRYCILAAAAAVILLLIILICKGCSSGDVLKGTWDMDGTTVYQFEGNGKGAMILPSNTYSFKYTINEEEKTVSIDFEDEKATDYTYSYTIDKDRLTLFGSVGKENFEYVFTKTKEK